MSRILTLPLEVFGMPQNSPEWLAARRGIVTASSFKDVMAKGEGKTRSKYLRQKVAEQMQAAPAESFSNGHTERGHLLEPEALSLYGFMQDVEPAPCGFMKRGPVGCSPDFLVSDDGMGQIKTMLPELLLDVLDRDQMPSEHTAQVQGELWVSGRQWSDFVGYWPGLPLFVKRIYRDEVFMARLGVEIESFLADMATYKASIESRYPSLKKAA